jgi:hypothetical protein
MSAMKDLAIRIEEENRQPIVDEIAHARFMAIAYGPSVKFASRTFKNWPPQKRDDAQAEFMAKMWDQWSRLEQRGKDPVPMLKPLLHWAKRWVEYDRRLSGRARNIDIQDYRAGMTQHLMSSRGEISPHDRSSRMNSFLDFNPSSRVDDPSELASALESTGIALMDWSDA